MTRYDLLLPRGGPRSLVEVTRPGGAAPGERAPGLRGPSFDEIFAGAIGGSVKVAPAAQEALQARGIELGQVDLERIGRAMDLIAKKGGRESLLLGERAAFVVDVPERTVTTAVARGELEDHVFTRIDSAVIL